MVAERSKPDVKCCAKRLKGRVVMLDRRPRILAGVPIQITQPNVRVMLQHLVLDRVIVTLCHCTYSKAESRRRRFLWFGTDQLLKILLEGK